MADFFWFSDSQRARIEPLLPTDSRGKARVDDRRVLSGIVHALKNGGRWADCPHEVYGPKKTLYNRFVRWAERGIWEDTFSTPVGAEDVPGRLFIDSTCIKVHRCAGGGKGGGLAHGIGHTKGGRNTNLHAVCDGKGRPLVLLLTPGNVHDCKPARRCLEAMPPARELVADKGYGSKALREWLEDRGTTAVIPPRKNRKVQYDYDDDIPLWDKVRTIARTIYGADDIMADKKVRDQFHQYEDAGFGHFPVCMAKTQYSFSTDPNLKGAPSGHMVPIREIRISAGAEFLVVICGEIMTMPGLPRVPSAVNIHLDDKGLVQGLF